MSFQLNSKDMTFEANSHNGSSIDYKILFKFDTISLACFDEFYKTATYKILSLSYLGGKLPLKTL